MRLLSITMTLLFLAPVQAMADAACDKPRNDFDGLYCLNKVYQDADAQLNTWFSRVRGKLIAGGQAGLRSSQIGWLRERDEKCSRHEESGFYVNLACATQMTVQRTEFLESHYRECLASGCSGASFK